MRIFVEQNEKLFTFEIDQNEKIVNAKLKIIKLLGINENYFCLIYDDKILFDGDETVTEFGISDKSLINVVRNGVEIFIKTVDGEIFNIFVQKTMKILDIKCIIHEKIGMRPNQQVFICQNILLDNYKTVDEYQICEKSMIDIVARSLDRMEITVKTMNGKTFLIHADKMDRIIEMKLKIQEKMGLHPDEQILYYYGGMLDDEKTVDEYQMCEKSLIHLYIETNEKIKIIFKTWDEKTFEFYIERSDKIIDIKHKIQKIVDLHLDDQILICRNITLDNEKTIEEFGICENFEINIEKKMGDFKNSTHDISMLQVEREIDEYQICNNLDKSNSEILINLEIFDGKKFVLYVEKQTRIIDIKNKINNLIHLHPIKQNLYYQGTLLIGNENTVEEIQGIHNTGFLRSVIKRLIKPIKAQPQISEMKISLELNNDWLEIFIETANQIRYKLFVLKKETILEVKYKIYLKVKLEPDEQILLYNQSILENNKTVEQSNIVDRAVLQIEFDLKMWINIDIKMLNGNKWELYLMTTDKIRDVKVDIEEKIGINRDVQMLMHNGEILLDENTVDQYQITNKSTIDIRLRSENTITCDASEYENLGNIKKIIRNQNQIKNNQKIILCSASLIDNKLFYEFDIKDGEQTNKLTKFIQAIKSGSIVDVRDSYDKILLERKHGTYFCHPIHYACKYGFQDITNYLISEGCNLEATDSENRRPMHYLCTTGNLELLNILMQHNANVEASDFLKRRPIHIACLHGHHDIVKQLIGKKCDLEACDYNNKRPIHYACVNGQVEITQLLIDNNCDIESLDSFNRSPLVITKENKSESMIEILNEEITNRKNIRIVADAMQLRCIGDECDHKFCYISILSKKILTGQMINKEKHGKVYHCKESITGRYFAYKKFVNESISCKYIEGNINDYIETIRHERIIKYFGGFQLKQNKIIFMEFLETRSLKEKLKDQMPENDVIRFIKQLLEALGFLNERRIIHRDIKPDNILLDENGNIKLTNFQFSLSFDKIEDERTKTSTFCGTINYVAPEIICQKLYSYFVDIWSLGVTVVEMATKETLFKNMNHRQILNTISKMQPIKYELPDSSLYFHNLKIIIEKMLETNLEQRSSAILLSNELSVYFPKSVYQY